MTVAPGPRTEPRPPPPTGPLRPDGRLPVADRARVRRAAADLLRRDGRAFAAVLAVNAAAAAAGLVAPYLLGRIVDAVRGGAGTAAVDRPAVAVVGFAAAHLLLTRWARLLAHRFGERVSARVRERFVERALALPAAAVERAGTGDLASRGTSDVGTVAATLRDAAPEVLIGLVQAALILGAVFLLAPALGACAVVGLSGIWFAARWYLRRARDAYLEQSAAGAAVAEVVASTAAGARTVEALGLGRRRVAACGARIGAARTAQERTLFLRSVLFPVVDTSYVLPVVGVLLVGGLLHGRGLVGLGAVVSCALYLRQLSAPLDTVLQRLEELQSSGASFARVEGLQDPPAAPASDGPAPAGDRIEVRGARYAYPGGRQVLRGLDLTVRPGERLAVVGPSGAGKTTLARLLAGIEPPDAGEVLVGGVPVADLAPRRLRRQVVLVTQEHHVFLGTVRDNLLIAAPSAADAELRAALAAVGAGWVDGLARGLDTELGTADGPRLDGVRAQQLALARVVLADPHTVVLDEATALLDPAAARHTERALAAALAGRTVIAVAHRLHTAHDADRVAVLVDGRLAELGPHGELVAADGAYAALWRSWHGEGPER